MAVKDLSLEDILERITLVLPSKHTRDDDTNLMAIFEGISQAFKINTDILDELFRQEFLDSSSGEYTDEYITSLSGIGRKTAEEDTDYKTRYKRRIFAYNCSKAGMEQAVTDIFEAPLNMYNAGKRGAYTDARYYYNDVELRSTYGDTEPDIFTGYIQISERPDDDTFIELCKVLSDIKAAGVRIYLTYPQS